MDNKLFQVNKPVWVEEKVAVWKEHKVADWKQIWVSISIMIIFK